MFAQDWLTSKTSRAPPAVGPIFIYLIVPRIWILELLAETLAWAFALVCLVPPLWKCCYVNRSYDPFLEKSDNHTMACEGFDMSSIAVDILDVDQLLGSLDDENWLVETSESRSASGGMGDFMVKEDPLIMVRKRSLVNKLDSIARTNSSSSTLLSPISSASSSNRTSNLSPGVSSYLRQNFSSTPVSANKSGMSCSYLFGL